MNLEKLKKINKGKNSHKSFKTSLIANICIIELILENKCISRNSIQRDISS